MMMTGESQCHRMKGGCRVGRAGDGGGGAGGGRRGTGSGRKVAEREWIGYLGRLREWKPAIGWLVLSSASTCIVLVE